MFSAVWTVNGEHASSRKALIHYLIMPVGEGEIERDTHKRNKRSTTTDHIIICSHSSFLLSSTTLCPSFYLISLPFSFFFPISNMKHIFDYDPYSCLWDDVSSTTSSSSSTTSTVSQHCAPPRNKKRRRGVTFFHDAFVYDVDRVDPASNDTIWYSKDEIRSLKLQAKQIIVLAQQGRLLAESEHHTYHGLDKFVWAAWTNQKSIKHRVLDAVLTEQVRQYNTYGRVDSDSLAVVYQKTMEDCLWAKETSAKQFSKP